ASADRFASADRTHRSSYCIGTSGLGWTLQIQLASALIKLPFAKSCIKIEPRVEQSTRPTADVVRLQTLPLRSDPTSWHQNAAGLGWTAIRPFHQARVLRVRGPVRYHSATIRQETLCITMLEHLMISLIPTPW